MPSTRRLIHVIAISGAGQSYRLRTLPPLRPRCAAVGRPLRGRPRSAPRPRPAPPMARPVARLRQPGTLGDAGGGRRGGLWSEVRTAASGTAASGRKIASVAEGTPPRAGGPGRCRSLARVDFRIVRARFAGGERPLARGEPGGAGRADEKYGQGAAPPAEGHVEPRPVPSPGAGG